MEVLLKNFKKFYTKYMRMTKKGETQRCFFCLEKVEKSTKEHIIPQWILREAKWKNKHIRGFADTFIEMSRIKIKCCGQCNNVFLGAIEEKMKNYFLNGDEVGKKDAFLWVTKILIGYLQYMKMRQPNMPNSRMVLLLRFLAYSATRGEELDLDWANLSFQETKEEMKNHYFFSLSNYHMVFYFVVNNRVLLFVPFINKNKKVYKKIQNATSFSEVAPWLFHYFLEIKKAEFRPLIIKTENGLGIIGIAEKEVKKHELRNDVLKFSKYYFNKVFPNIKKYEIYIRHGEYIQNIYLISSLQVTKCHKE
ncbi:MAG: hypothetical protein HRT98_02505 [Mycoplasmatales bacterium]|nr:hypothetical protein [Mycoplasmatales bacterium]